MAARAAEQTEEAFRADPETGILDEVDRAEKWTDSALQALWALFLGYYHHFLINEKGLPGSFYLTQKAVDTLADQMHPNTFSGILRIIEKLEDLEPSVSQPPETWIAWQGNPAVARQWKHLLHRLEPFLQQAILRTSVHRKWFNCGDCLGRLSFFDPSEIEVFMGDYWKALQHRLRKLPDLMFEVDPWLQKVCDATVSIDNSQDLIALLPTGQSPQPVSSGFEKGRESFYECLLARICDAMLRVPSSVFSQEDHLPGKETVSVKWVGALGELRINGEKVEDCTAETIQKTGMKESYFRRDAFIYTAAMRVEPYDAIVRDVGRHTKWEPIGTVPGVKEAARRFAERFRLPLVTPRTTSAASKRANR